MIKNKGILPITAKMLTAAILLLMVFIALFPLLWMIFTSIKPQREIFSVPPRIFSDAPSYSNYLRVVFQSSIPRAFINSTIVALGATAGTLLLSSFAAYGLARYRFIGSSAVSVTLLFGQMMPGVVVLLPLYLFYSKVGFIDSYRILILTNLAVSLPMGVLTLTPFIKNISVDIDGSAMIDGASGISTLFRIILPIASPGLVTIGIFSFLNTWEEYLFAVNFTNSAAYKTLPVSLAEFKGQFVIDWGGMMSAAVIISVPVLLLFLLCNKYFIQGIADGAVKG